MSARTGKQTNSLRANPARQPLNATPVWLRIKIFSVCVSVHHRQPLQFVSAERSTTRFTQPLIEMARVHMQLNRSNAAAAALHSENVAKTNLGNELFVDLSWKSFNLAIFIDSALRKRCAWGLSSATALMNWILWLINHEQQGGGWGWVEEGPNLQVNAACDPEREVAACDSRGEHSSRQTVAEFLPSFYMQMKHWSSIDLWSTIFPCTFVTAVITNTQLRPESCAGSGGKKKKNNTSAERGGGECTRGIF